MMDLAGPGQECLGPPGFEVFQFQICGSPISDWWSEGHLKDTRMMRCYHVLNGGAWSFKVMSDLSQYGLTSPYETEASKKLAGDRKETLFYKQRFLLLTNDSALIKLENTCDGAHHHQPIEGSGISNGKHIEHARLSQGYPWPFCRAFTGCCSEALKMKRQSRRSEPCSICKGGRPECLQTPVCRVHGID